MAINISFSASTGTGATTPPTYINDVYVSSYYTVSVVNGWSVTGTPTSVQIYLWRKVDGEDTVGLVLTLIGENQDSVTVDIPTGASVTGVLPGDCAYVGATVILGGGSSPTFTGTVVLDGQFRDTTE